MQKGYDRRIRYWDFKYLWFVKVLSQNKRYMKAKSLIDPRTEPEEVEVDPTKLEGVELFLYRTREANKIASKLRHVPVDHVVLPTREECEPYLSPL